MGLFEDIENGENTGIETLACGTPLRKQDIKAYMNEYTVDYLKVFYKFIFGKTTAMKKADLVNEILDLICFPTEGLFREWFFSMPGLVQIILCRVAFTDCLPVPILEKELGIPLVQRNDKYWRSEWKFNPNLNANLDFLPAQNSYACPVITAPMFFRKALLAWLAPPALTQLPNCRIAEQAESYDNSLLIADTLPLLCDAINTVMEGINLGKGDEEKLVRNGFRKKDVGELRSSTGFLPFGMESDYAPSSVELAARFVLCMHNHKPRRPQDGQEAVRVLVQAFFGEKTQYPHSRWHAPDRAYLESNICIDHLSRTPNYYLESNGQLPVSRKVFHDIILYAARDGSWFDADALAGYIRANGANFSFCYRDTERHLKAKADTFEFEGLVFKPGYSGDFRPDGIMRFYLLVRPLFKAYCYIFAALGLLEITQLKPPLARSHKNKKYPFSPYDSLKAIRVTELGRWCLGLSGKRPERPAQEYQAIADRELLLVTVQGNSLERRVYLDKIGQRLGEDRWRVSPGSFIAGCINPRQIAERIERFKLLIDPKPAPHWEQLFKKVVDRAGLFDKKRSDMLVYDLPEDREIQEELLHDPEIKRIVRRAEGRMLAVAAKNQSKFYALLAEHGIAHF